MSETSRANRQSGITMLIVTRKDDHRCKLRLPNGLPVGFGISEAHAYTNAALGLLAECDHWQQTGWLLPHAASARVNLQGMTDHASNSTSAVAFQAESASGFVAAFRGRFWTQRLGTQRARAS